MRQDIQNDELTTAVAEFIRRRRLILRGWKVVVAVSGGMDSVAMLAVLRCLAEGASWELSVAHLNHSLRPEADADAQFVADLTVRWGIPATVEKVDVAAYAQDRSIGLEQAGRQVRYEFFRRLAMSAGARCVAVAHHADDQVETILYRILRGTHLRGLGGMPARRMLGSEKGTGSFFGLFEKGACPLFGQAKKQNGDRHIFQTTTTENEPVPILPVPDSPTEDEPVPISAVPILLVRPMLEVRRSRIEAFCQRHGLAWRTDSSNTDLKFRRNFIRHSLLPMIRQKLNPRIDQGLISLARSARQAEDALVAQAQLLLEQAVVAGDDSEFVLNPARLVGEKTIVQTTVLRLAVERMGLGLGAITSRHLNDMRRVLKPTGPVAVNLPGDWQFIRIGQEVRLRKTPAGEVVADRELEIELSCPGVTALPGGAQVRCSLLPYNNEEVRAHVRSHPPGVELLDAAKVRGRLVCRRRRRGDRFRPLGSPGQQSVSDFLTNSKLPPADRRRVWAVCDDEGIVYLAPLRIASRARLTAATKEVLRIEVIAGG